MAIFFLMHALLWAVSSGSPLSASSLLESNPSMKTDHVTIIRECFTPTSLSPLGIVSSESFRIAAKIQKMIIVCSCCIAVPCYINNNGYAYNTWWALAIKYPLNGILTIFPWTHIIWGHTYVWTICPHPKCNFGAKHTWHNTSGQSILILNAIATETNKRSVVGQLGTVSLFIKAAS